MNIYEKKYTSKKTGKTTIYYYAAVYDPAKEDMAWTTSCKTKKDAKAAGAQLLLDIENGEPQVKKQKTTFDEVAELWFGAMKKHYANSTVQGDKYYYKKYIKPGFGSLSIQKITPKAIQAWKNYMDEKYAASLVNKALNKLSLMFDFAIDTLELIKKNPCNRIKRSKIVKKDCLTWTEEETRYFLGLGNVRKSSYYDLLLLSFTTAMRPGEVCGVLESQYSKDGVLKLQTGFDRYGEITDMKTDRSKRSLYLSPKLHKAFECRRLTKEFQRRQGIPVNDFLFTQKSGKPITPDMYSKAFKRLLRAHNKLVQSLEDAQGFLPTDMMLLPDIRLYDARHSWGTNRDAEGLPTSTLCEVMGNTARVFQDNYVHVNDDRVKNVLLDYAEKII